MFGFQQLVFFHLLPVVCTRTQMCSSENSQNSEGEGAATPPEMCQMDCFQISLPKLVPVPQLGSVFTPFTDHGFIDVKVDILDNLKITTYQK